MKREKTDIIKYALFFLILMGKSSILVGQTTIIEPIYQNVRGFSNGLAAVCKNGKWGYINLRGDEVIAPQYSDVQDFHDGLAAVCVNDYWGFIDKNNTFVISPKYFAAHHFSCGLAAVAIEKTSGGEDMFSYKGHDSNSWIYIDMKGNMPLKKRYRYAYSYSNGYACVYDVFEKELHYIDKEGKKVYSSGTDTPFPYSDGLLPKMDKETLSLGYCDINGSWVIDPQYSSVSEFIDGLAVVEKFEEGFMIINTKGETIFKGQNPKVLSNGYIYDKKNLYDKRDYKTPCFTGDVEVSMFYYPYKVINYNLAGYNRIIYDQEHQKVRSLFQPSNGLFGFNGPDSLCGFLTLNINDYINGYVSYEMGQWLKRGEFETTSAYEIRTSEENCHRKMTTYANDIINNWLNKNLDEWSLSDYDADKECFTLQTDFGQFPVEIPASQAKSFKANWKNTGKTVAFGYRNGLVLQSISFQQPNGFSLTQVVDQSDNSIRTKSLATLAWPDWDESTDKPDFDLKVGVKSVSKISRVEVSVNGVVNRGIKTVEKDRYDLVINRSLTLNEGANVIRVSVTNDVGTTQEEKTINYRPLGKDLPSIDWLDFASTASKQDYLLKLGIKSKSKIEDVSITINGALSRGVKTVKTDDYTMTVNRTITLSEGTNRIVVSVRNAEGVSTSERVITYNGITPQPVIKEKRIALVIGNSKYEGNVNSLTNPYNDATDIGQKLKKLGFETIVLYDGTKKEMNNAISSFVEKARNYDVALFYYAGHGLQLQTDIGGTNYLIPVDAQLVYKCDAEDCISANRIVAQLEASGCNIRLIILDACRDLPNLKECSRGSSNGGFSEISSSVGTYIMYSTREGKTAEDGKGHNSPFAEGILKYIEDTNVPVEEFFKKVGEWVDVKTGYKQSPWPSGRIRGNFYFNRQ